MHRARHLASTVRLCAVSLLCALCAAGAARAVTVPGLFAVIVPARDPDQAARDALRAVLVRLTGNREAGSDPLFLDLIDAARRYVQVERGTTDGQTQVLFDADALRSAVEAAGGRIWDTDRPLLWVSVPAAAPGAGETTGAGSLAARLTAEATARGVPLLLRTEAASPGGALEAARAAGAAAALWATPMAGGQGLQWTLASPGVSGQWIVGPEAAIDAAADALANAARQLAQAPVGEYECHIADVADLSSFADVLGTVGSAPGVMQIDVPEVDGDTLTLRVRARGTAQMLAQVLRSDRMQAAADSSGTALDFRYRRTP